MARPKSQRTLNAERKKLSEALNIVGRLQEQAKTDSATDPKAFLEFLTLSVYHDELLSADADNRRRAARDMLNYTLSKKGKASAVTPGDKKPFAPELPPTKPVEIPENIQAKVHQIRASIPGR